MTDAVGIITTIILALLCVAFSAAGLYALFRRR